VYSFTHHVGRTPVRHCMLGCGVVAEWASACVESPREWVPCTGQQIGWALQGPQHRLTALCHLGAAGRVSPPDQMSLDVTAGEHWPAGVTWCPWAPVRLSPGSALQPQAIYLRLPALKTLLSKLAVTLR
jgi:hypothetical protein